MRYYYACVVLLTSFNTLSSCKKHSTTLTQNETLLTQHGWVVASIHQKVNNSGWVDIFSPLQTCKKDNRTFFNPNHSIVLDEGTIKCNSSDLQTIQYGTWEFASNETTLSSTSPSGINIESSISRLDDTSLIMLNKQISGTDTTITESKYVH